MFGPLTPAQKQRVELQIWLTPVYVWLVFAWGAYALDLSTAGSLDRSGHIKGHDFAHFYVLGEIANQRATDDFFSFTRQAARMDRLVPEYENRFVPVYGPQVALLFAPLARLPYTTAVACWLLATAAIYGACCFAMWRALPALSRHGWEALVLCAGFPPFYSLIASGHITVLALACCTAAFFALRSKRTLLAGFLFGSLFFKPALGLVLPFVFAYARNWRLIAGAAAAIAFQLAIPAAIYGPTIVSAYFDALTQLGTAATLLEPQPYQMHSLRSFFSILLPWPRVALICYAIAAAIVATMAAVFWKSDKPVERRLSVLLIAMVLVDPHVNSYDLVLIAPALLVAAAAATPAARSFWLLLYACYFLPALPAFARHTRVQLSVPLLGVVMSWLAHRAPATTVRGRFEQTQPASSRGERREGSQTH